MTILLGLLIAFGIMANAQMEDPVKWKKYSEKNDDGTVDLVFEAKIDMHWHLYSQYFDEGGPVRTTFFIEESDKFELVGKPTEKPEPEEVFDEIFEINIKYFSDKAVFRQKIKVLTNEAFSIPVSIEYQVCQEDKCVYFNPDFTIKVAGSEVKAEVAPIEKSGDMEQKSLWGLFFMALLFGFAGILTPCVFPMIPMTVSFFMQGESSKFNTILN